MNTVALCCCWHLAPYAMAPAPSGIVGMAPSRDPTAWAKLSPSSNPPPSCMRGGTSPRTRLHLNSLYLVGQSPRWAACLSTGGASASSVGNERTLRAVHALAVWAGSLSIRACTKGLVERFWGVWGVHITKLLSAASFSRFFLPPDPGEVLVTPPFFPVYRKYW